MDLAGDVPSVLDLSDLGESHRGWGGPELGGKGAALVRLVDEDYRVPATGVVTTSGYRRIAVGEQISAVVEQIKSGAVIDAQEVDGVFAGESVDPGLEQELVELAREVGGGGPIAVRSSATVEDLHGSSFAGQYRSVLNVDSGDRDAVMSAIRQVWASLWHPAPVAYRRAFGIDENGVAMAVVLMAMIPATTAGVVFTVDPGGSDGARVEAVEGLGEALVSGAETPSAWVVPSNGPEPADLAVAARKALDLALDIEERFEAPQDVEWAAVGDEVFIVQARPITVLDSDDGFDTEVDDHELTTAGIVEMVPGVLAPLQWDLNRLLLEEAFRSVLDDLGIIRGSSAEDRPFVRRVRGQVAIDFDQLREAAGGIPGAVAELELQYFGASVSPEDSESSHGMRRSASRRLSTLAHDIRALRTRRRVIEQADVVVGACEGLRTRQPLLSAYADIDLFAYARRLIDLAGRGLSAELGVAAAAAAAYRHLEAVVARHLGSAEASRVVLLLTSAAVSVNREPTSSAALFGGATWNELGTVPPSPIRVQPEDGYGPLEALEKRLQSLAGWRRRRILTGQFIDLQIHVIRRSVSDVTEQLHRREATKAAVLELGGELRRVHTELGVRLKSRGLLSEPGDVDLLSSSELVAASLEGQVPAIDTLRRRRNWLSRYVAEGPLPLRFTGIPDREPEPLPEGDVLSGWAASPGRARGMARVVTRADGALEPGEVLVASSTDASWSPLFVKAGAVVVERGGPLSHAAILARELGLPAVLNLPGAIRVLDGCTVSVDGDSGVVVIEKRALP